MRYGFLMRQSQLQSTPVNSPDDSSKQMVARSNRVARSASGRGILVREFRVSLAILGGEYHCEYHLPPSG
jgi:hypothetical protein